MQRWAVNAAPAAASWAMGRWGELPALCSVRTQRLGTEVAAKGITGACQEIMDTWQICRKRPSAAACKSWGLTEAAAASSPACAYLFYSNPILAQSVILREDAGQPDIEIS